GICDCGLGVRVCLWSRLGVPFFDRSLFGLLDRRFGGFGFGGLRRRGLRRLVDGLYRLDGRGFLLSGHKWLGYLQRNFSTREGAGAIRVTGPGSARQRKSGSLSALSRRKEIGLASRRLWTSRCLCTGRYLSQ